MDWNLINYNFIFFKDDFITSGRKYYKKFFHFYIHILEMAATTWWLTNKKLSLSINNFTTNLYNITFLFISPN